MKIVVSIVVLNLLVTCRAVSAFSILKKRGYIAYFMIGTLCRMTFKELLRVRNTFFMNVRVC